MKQARLWLRDSFWTWCFALLLTGAVYAAYARRIYGFGRATHLNDVFPWGLGMALNVHCGVALAAGGFSIAAIVYILKPVNCKPIVRAGVVTGFIGYVVAVLGLLSDLGRPVHIGSLITAWNPHSIHSGIIWALAVYGATLLSEFAPELFQRFGQRDPPAWARLVTLPLLLVAVAFSTMQLFSLADPLLAAPRRFSPLWSSPELPFFYFISAVCGGLAVVIFASWHTRAAYAKGLSASVMTRMGRALAVALCLYLAVRFTDFTLRGVPLLVWKMDPENLLLGLEMSFFFVPAWLLIFNPDRDQPRRIYLSAVLVLAGLMVNRLNTCITAVETVTGSRYLPSWNEVLTAYSGVAIGIAAFAVGVKQWSVFPETE